ncbi:MAG: hypothetical protein P8Y13_07405 [Deinococcales bacterium]
MMRTLSRILLAVGVMMALGVTLALGFDESRIDFQNEDLETAYVALDQTGEGLTVVLSATKVAGYVGTMDVEDNINDFDEDDFDTGDIVKYLGQRPWSPKTFPDVVEVKHASTFYTMVRLRHDQMATTVTDAYLARLADLGYAVSEQSLTTNITVYTLTMGEDTVRMVVARRGADTLVTLSQM